MSETLSQHEPDDRAGHASAESSVGSAPGRPARRKRRIRRIALIAVASLVAVVGAVALGGFLAVRHLEGNIHRIPNVFNRLTAATRPVMPAATQHSMTILMTGSDKRPVHRGGSGVLGSSTAPQVPSGLVSLVHINASNKAGAIVNIPANVVVRIPGHGRGPIYNSLKIGGPSLFIATVQRLTGVRIDHYTVVDDAGLASALRPLGGVDITLPAPVTSNGVTFHAGVDHLTSANALDYTEQPGLSEQGHALRQQALLRAIMDKLASKGLLANPASSFATLNAFTKALSVDSNFSNSQLQSLAMHLNLVGSSAGAFVTAPANGTHLNSTVSSQLWNAVRNDAVSAFARQHPADVTPAAPH